MIRTIVAAALAGAALQAGALHAQESENAGFLLGLHTAALGLEGVGEETFQEQGMGLGLTVGWGFGDRFALYGTVDGGAIEYDPDNPAAAGEDYEVLTVDLGARMSFGNEFRRLRPFINAAISGVVTSEEDPEEGTTVDTSGGGLTAGGGVQYFYRPRWALLLGIQATMGAFTEADDGDTVFVFTEGIPYSHFRVQLGVDWHP
ncbi:MAG TPA: outer membrane beta-barrel protein [Longimicrobium sp.]|nr:outer membrane beta-barrel protein [Longimicrobium sp.]